MEIFDEDVLMEEEMPEYQEETRGRPMPQLVWWEDWSACCPLGINFNEWAQWLSESADRNQRNDIKRGLRTLNDQMRSACLNLWRADHCKIMGPADNFTFLMENDLDDYSITSAQISMKLGVFLEYIYLLMITTLEEE